MKKLSIQLPEPLAAQIAAEARKRNVSMAEVVRQRLERTKPTVELTMYDLIADLIGSVDGLPEDLGARKKHYLKATGFGLDGSRRRKLPGSAAK